jgi:hypothetical protein
MAFWMPWIEPDTTVLALSEIATPTALAVAQVSQEQTSKLRSVTTGAGNYLAFTMQA